MGRTKVDPLQKQIGGFNLFGMAQTDIGTRWIVQRLRSSQSPVLGCALVEMDALSLNYWMVKFGQEAAKPSKERYPPKTLYQIVFGMRRYVVVVLVNEYVK